jgi:predicted MPP superfamily phosphohydrolase
MTPRQPLLFEELEHRIDRNHLARRLALQVDHSAKFFGRGFGRFHWENINLLPLALELLLKVSGLFQVGKDNVLDFEVVEVDVMLEDLPEAFEDFCILHLSDIHIDGMPDGGERLISIIKKLHYDVCVLTGDFSFPTFGNSEPSLNGMKKLAASIECHHGIFGVLGNHDSVEMVPALESYGIRMLLNETVRVARGDASITILGLDDAHFYGVDSLDKAIRDVPADEVKVLLVHSPELIAEAARAGVNYYLCGHTHGGQICLPGGVPVLTNARCARKYVGGVWHYENMAGYTSRGTGSSYLPVRFFCPPEITLHRFVRLL